MINLLKSLDAAPIINFLSVPVAADPHQPERPGVWPFVHSQIAHLSASTRTNGRLRLIRND